MAPTIVANHVKKEKVTFRFQTLALKVAVSLVMRILDCVHMYSCKTKSCFDDLTVLLLPFLYKIQLFKLIKVN